MTGPPYPTHRCPGCHAPGVPNFMFACKPCWYRLPAVIRTAINEGWAARRRDGGDAHTVATRDAIDWYAHNPRGGDRR